MRQLYYTLQTLLRSRGGNLVKLLSLTLGLLVGILLFSQIAYELNYDTCYKEHERLTMFGTRYEGSNDFMKDWDYASYRPAAAALMESLPELVECASPFLGFYNPKLYIGDNPVQESQVICADTLYFRTAGIEVL